MSPKKDETEQYREISIKSAGKLKSILLLVDRAILLLNQAKEDESLVPANIVKVQNILAQLERALNFKRGTSAGDLFFVYDYLFVELNNRDEQSINTSLNMLRDLKDIFLTIQKNFKK